MPWSSATPPGQPSGGSCKCLIFGTCQYRAAFWTSNVGFLAFSRRMTGFWCLSALGRSILSPTAFTGVKMGMKCRDCLSKFRTSWGVAHGRNMPFLIPLLSAKMVRKPLLIALAIDQIGYRLLHCSVRDRSAAQDNRQYLVAVRYILLSALVIMAVKIARQPETWSSRDP